MFKVYLDDLLYIIDGSLIVISISLSYFHNRNWIYLAVIVAANMIQFGFTNWCPIKWLLKSLGFEEREK